MKFYIPSIGHVVRLTKEWEFPLYAEYRNYDMMSRIKNQQFKYSDAIESIVASLEKGTVLRIDRIYIRKGKSEFDSITFCIVESPRDKKTDKSQPKFKGGRFWAKLDDVNEINFEKVE